MRRPRLLACFALFLLTSAVARAAPASDVGVLITASEGIVVRVDQELRGSVPAFVKLKTGDRLSLGENARLKLVYFASARQETWAGKGVLEIGEQQGSSSGLPPPEVKILPEILARQIAKTPTLDSQGRAGVVRLRSIPTPDALAKLDGDYRRLRMEAVASDLNPELFLLSGLLEMRQLERIDQVLAFLNTAHAGNPEAKVIAALYRKATRNLRESGKEPL